MPHTLYIILLQAGIDQGEVHCRVNPATGRMAYMGKIMNRAARISNQATSSQVGVCHTTLPCSTAVYRERQVQGRAALH